MRRLSLLWILLAFASSAVIAAVSGTELFIRVTANKKKVHEQEPVLLTYKIYTLVDLTELEGDMPDLQGCHAIKVEPDEPAKFHEERLNGRTYKCVTWCQYVVYPQVTGELTIPGITYTGTVVREEQGDPIENFFNGGAGYTEEECKVVAPSITIHVAPLPTRPKDFSGGVGKFRISASMDKGETKAGEPVMLRVVVEGVGNLKLLKKPTVTFPKDFERYEPKVTDSTKFSSRGYEGSMVYDFQVVPINQGRYVIPAATMTYFDVDAEEYRTIRTDSFALAVGKGDFHSRIDWDIHPLKKGNVSQRPTKGFFFASWKHVLLIVLLLGIYVVALWICKRRATYQADGARVRSDKASGVATQRLKRAQWLMEEGRSGDFYDEVLHALWTYVADKFGLPVVSLSAQNIRERLSEQHVGKKVVEQFVAALDECEFERYAPGDQSGNMEKTFDSAMTAIMEIEKTMRKRKRTGGKVLMLVGALLLMGSTSSAHGVTKWEADSAYLDGNYQLAIKNYKELLKKGVAADLLYNLGNAYYCTNEPEQAVWAYERAHRLAPIDEDISYNLQLACSKADKAAPESEMFFVTWYKAVVTAVSVDTWTWIGVSALAVAMLLSLFLFFGSAMAARKAALAGVVFMLLLSLLAHVFAWQQRTVIEELGVGNWLETAK